MSGDNVANKHATEDVEMQPPTVRPNSERSSKGIAEQDEPENDDDVPTHEASDGKHVESSSKTAADQAAVMATEDFSVFTIPQKRAIVVAG